MIEIIIITLAFIVFIVAISIDCLNVYWLYKNIKDKKTSSIPIVPLILYLISSTIFGQERTTGLHERGIDTEIIMSSLILIHIIIAIITPLFLRLYRSFTDKT